MGTDNRRLEAALAELVGKLAPGARIERIESLSESQPDRGHGTAKFLGYGASLRLTLRTPEGDARRIVFRTSRSDDFGHDRRADRAANALLAYDTFGLVPQHAPALDVGAIGDDERLHSLRGAGEFYTVTDYVAGAPYADDLWRIAREKRLEPRDLGRCDALASYLSRLHAEKIDAPGAYRRAIRDLVGHGEGIFGLADNFPDNAPGAPIAQVANLEKLAADWRWRLRGKGSRLSRTHGDFHPFNILFDDQDRLALLDASRGCQGDPADDVTCLSINYLFFALEHRDSWTEGFVELWRRFWKAYLEEASDGELLEAAPPYWAWRTLVLANPRWYPNASAETRATLLRLAQQALERGRLELGEVEKAFQ